jgi:hypothetical protein
MGEGCGEGGMEDRGEKESKGRRKGMEVRRMAEKGGWRMERGAEGVSMTVYFDLLSSLFLLISCPPLSSQSFSLSSFSLLLSSLYFLF